MNYKITRVLVAVLAIALVTACAPEVGSERWCNAMKEKSKMDWTASETADYAKHCLFESDEDSKDDKDDE